MPIGESAPAARPRSLNALTLATAGMDRAVDFYERLGFACIYGGPSAPFTTFRVGDQFLNLTAELPPEGGWWGRVIFFVGDVDAAYRQAIARGLVPEFAPRDAPWDERYFHIRDPDGHEISLAHPIGAKRREAAD